MRAISKYKPLGGLYLKGRFNGGFFALRFGGGGLIFGGAYAWSGLFSEFYLSLRRKIRSPIEKNILGLNGKMEHD